jgi:hypothetical protein
VGLTFEYEEDVNSVEIPYGLLSYNIYEYWRSLLLKTWQMFE